MCVDQQGVLQITHHIEARYRGSMHPTPGISRRVKRLGLLTDEGEDESPDVAEEVEGAYKQPWAEEHGLQLIGGMQKSTLQSRRRHASAKADSMHLLTVASAGLLSCSLSPVDINDRNKRRAHVNLQALPSHRCERVIGCRSSDGL